MLHVGLTGGIASGKSTVLGLFVEKGACAVDLDQLARYVEEPGRPAWHALVDYFGQGILQDDGTINRGQLGEIVFQDEQKRIRLNEIVHPFIFQEWERRLAALNDYDCEAIVISDMPLLFEIGAERYFDRIIVVYASREQQLQRLMERNNLSPEQARLRLESQLAIDSKLPLADYVIDNSSSPAETRKRVAAVWDELKRAHRS